MSNDEIDIEPSLRRMILIELIFPVVLLVLGIYHGLMQVLYRSGMIHTRKILGLEYYQGLTLHGVVNAIVFTTFFAVAFGYAVIRFYLGRVKHESRVALLRVNDDRNVARSSSDPLRQGERALHILSAAACASGILHWTHAHRRRFLDCIF